MAYRTDIGLRERRVFLLLIFLYLTLLMAREREIGSEILHSYATDFLFIPILMTSVKIVRALFHLSFALSTKEIVIAVVYTSVVYEWLLPNTGTNFVSDPFDILAYSVGALVYVLVIAKSSKGTGPKKKICTLNLPT